jgi:hypothetical protein
MSGLPQQYAVLSLFFFLFSSRRARQSKKKRPRSYEEDDVDETAECEDGGEGECDSRRGVGGAVLVLLHESYPANDAYGENGEAVSQRVPS